MFDTGKKVGSIFGEAIKQMPFVLGLYAQICTEKQPMG